MATNKDAVLNVIATISHCEEMLNYSGIGETIEPSCNDVMTIYIKVNEREIIEKASFTITNSACAPVKAAAEAPPHAAIIAPVAPHVKAPLDFINPAAPTPQAAKTARSHRGGRRKKPAGKTQTAEKTATSE
ncbi:MAG: hypothetical protein RR288_05345 [Oscillibacter sp.]